MFTDLTSLLGEIKNVCWARFRYIVMETANRVKFYMFDFINFTTRSECDKRYIFKRSLTGFNSEFSFSETGRPTKVKEASLSYYLSIAGGRIIGFIYSPRILALCEMQIAS